MRAVHFQPRRHLHGFTLVELLVVIGIIAVLIAVLLPALSAARRQAATVKCAAALREIGACFKMYEIDSKGYFPVARLNGWKAPGSATVDYYNVDGINYPLAPATPGSAASISPAAQAHWYVFLAKYATKSKVGNAANTDFATNADEARKTIFYGCPAFEGYHSGLTVDDTNVTLTGYGMNPFASWDYAYPAGDGFPPVNFEDGWKEYAVHDPTAATPLGSFLKAKAWIHPDRKLLIADSGSWQATSSSVPILPTYPPAVAPQPVMSSSVIAKSAQTYVDIYRHGKHPGVAASGAYDPYGGRFGYNILYADLHVATINTGGKEAYLSTRMRFPG